MLLQVEQVASRIRELRDILGNEPAEIAQTIGVSEDTYISYESGETDIPIGKLYLIANALGVDPTVLLCGDDPRMADYAIVRGGKGIEVQRYAGYRFSALAYNYVGREMEPMIVTLEPDDDKPDLVSHEGQEFNYIIEGKVAVTIRDREFILEAGDSIYFNPELLHGQRAVGGKARFLTVINEIKKQCER
ncbi:MAG: XRE family transcriptional regulator [Firmicutes bacterium]|nr:XRE family transcriptional regulator [Bacillota bacterium]